LPFECVKLGVPYYAQLRPVLIDVRQIRRTCNSKTHLVWSHWQETHQRGPGLSGSVPEDAHLSLS